MVRAAAAAPDGAPPQLARAALLVWVQAALVLLLGLVGALTDGVMSTALTSTNALGDRVVPSAGLLAVTITLHLLGALLVIAGAAVLTAFLRRGHRWTRVVVLVLAVARGVGLVTALLATAIVVVNGPTLLVPVAPPWWSTLGAALSAALFARMLADLYGPAATAWFASRHA